MTTKDLLKSVVPDDPFPSNGITETPAKIPDDLLEIYRGGGFLEKITTTFNKMWVGDTYLAAMLAFAVVSGRIKNIVSPLHTLIRGDPQSGKSDGVRTARPLMDKRVMITKRFTGKHLYYSKHARGTCIFHDEKVTDDVMEILRSALSEWYEDSIIGTVTTDRKPEDLRIPARTTLVVASADGRDSDDMGQDESRFLTFEIRKSPEQQEEICKWILQKHEDVSKDIAEIQTIWTAIPKCSVTFSAEPPYIIMPIRDWKRYLAMIQCHALLSGRTETNPADIAAVNDLWAYTKPMINSTTVALDRNEEAVYAILTCDPMSLKEIMETAGIHQSGARRALCGRNGTYDKPDGGIMSKNLRGKHVCGEKTKTGEWRFSLL